MMKHKASHEYKTSRDASIFHHGKFCISVYKSTNHIPKMLKGTFAADLSWIEHLRVQRYVKNVAKKLYQ